MYKDKPFNIITLLLILMFFNICMRINYLEKGVSLSNN